MRYIYTWGVKFTRNIYTIKKMSSSASSSSNRIAVCQMTSIGDREANLNCVRKLVEDASKEDVKMIFFPEACDYICENKKDMLAYTEPLVGGYLMTEYRKLAREHNVWLSMGGLHEKHESDPNKTYNCHVIIDNSGTIVQTYRKIHLFDVEIPEQGVRLKESDYCEGGKHIVTPVRTPVGNLGLSICYDLRFPELSVELAEMGAEILTYPSAFTDATGKAHWEALLRGRAIESQCYVVAAAQAGAHNAKRRSHGHALVVGPWGDVLADCGARAPAYVTADIDLQRLRDVRSKMPVFQHRRNDVYSLYALSLRDRLLPEHVEAGDCEKTVASESSPQQLESPAERIESQAQPLESAYSGRMYQFGHASVRESCVFHKTDLTYAFVNIRCVVPGHVLVAPIRCAERSENLTEEEATDFFHTVILVQKLMEKVHGTRSSTVNIQDGPDAGQTVKHVHCHVMPRKKGDFKENDLIYLELARHDRQTTTSPSTPPRSIEEMEQEAAMLREEMEKLLAQKTLQSNNV